MTQASSIPAEIADTPAVEPSGTSPAAESLPVSDEAAKLKAELDAVREQINKLKSIKDSETAAERRARLEAEAERERLVAELAAERDAHWRNFKKFAPEDEVAKAQAAYEQEAQSRAQQEVARAKWETWKWQTLGEAGVPAEEIKAARSNQQVQALLQQKREAKLLADKEAELTDKVLAKLRKEGVIQSATPPPKTPVDIGSAPVAKPKVTAADVAKLEAEWTRNSRNTKARDAYLKAVEEFTGNPSPTE